MTDISNEAVARMLEGVTPGSWRVDADGDVVSPEGPVAGPFYPDNFDTWPTWEQRKADARFIAWAREAVPALAARNAELEEKLSECGRAVNLAKYGNPDFAWSIHQAAMADLNARIAKLEEKNARLRGALVFYADRDDWDEFSDDEQAAFCDRNMGSKLGDDKGETARVALSETSDAA